MDPGAKDKKAEAAAADPAAADPAPAAPAAAPPQGLDMAAAFTRACRALVGAAAPTPAVAESRVGVLERCMAARVDGIPYLNVHRTLALSPEPAEFAALRRVVVPDRGASSPASSGPGEGGAPSWVSYPWEVAFAAMKETRGDPAAFAAALGPYAREPGSGLWSHGPVEGVILGSGGGSARELLREECGIGSGDGAGDWGGAGDGEGSPPPARARILAGDPVGLAGASKGFRDRAAAEGLFARGAGVARAPGDVDLMVRDWGLQAYPADWARERGKAERAARDRASEAEAEAEAEAGEDRKPPAGPGENIGRAPGAGAGAGGGLEGAHAPSALPIGGKAVAGPDPGPPREKAVAALRKAADDLAKRADPGPGAGAGGPFARVYTDPAALAADEGDPGLAWESDEGRAVSPGDRVVLAPATPGDPARVYTRMAGAGGAEEGNPGLMWGLTDLVLEWRAPTGRGDAPDAPGGSLSVPAATLAALAGGAGGPDHRPRAPEELARWGGPLPPARPRGDGTQSARGASSGGLLGSTEADGFAEYSESGLDFARNRTGANPGTDPDDDGGPGGVGGGGLQGPPARFDPRILETRIARAAMDAALASARDPGMSRVGEDEILAMAMHEAREFEPGPATRSLAPPGGSAAEVRAANAELVRYALRVSAAVGAALRAAHEDPSSQSARDLSLGAARADLSRFLLSHPAYPEGLRDPRAAWRRAASAKLGEPEIEAAAKSLAASSPLGRLLAAGAAGPGGPDAPGRRLAALDDTGIAASWPGFLPDPAELVPAPPEAASRNGAAAPDPDGLTVLSFSAPEPLPERPRPAFPEFEPLEPWIRSEPARAAAAALADGMPALAAALTGSGGASPGDFPLAVHALENAMRRSGALRGHSHPAGPPPDLTALAESLVERLAEILARKPAAKGRGAKVGGAPAQLRVPPGEMSAEIEAEVSMVRDFYRRAVRDLERNRESIKDEKMAFLESLEPEARRELADLRRVQELDDQIVGAASIAEQDDFEASYARTASDALADSDEVARADRSASEGFRAIDLENTVDD